MRAAVRDPGGAFGAPVALGPNLGAYDAAVSGRGDAVVTWAQARGSEERVVVARRSPRGPFGPPVALTPWRRSTRFAQTRVAVGVEPDGVATVAWALPSNGSGGDDGRSDLEATRAAPGAAFGPAGEVAQGHSDEGFGTGFAAFFIPERDRAYAPLDEPGLGLRAVISATGRVLLAWTAPRTLPDAPLAPMAATGTLDGGFGPPSELGSPADRRRPHPHRARRCGRERAGAAPRGSALRPAPAAALPGRGHPGERALRGRVRCPGLHRRRRSDERRWHREPAGRPAGRGCCSWRRTATPSHGVAGA